MMRNTTLALMAIHLATSLSAQSPVQVQLVPFATGLTQITDITHAGDERLFVTLQGGQIRIVQPNGSVLATPFLSIPVQNNGTEQGLLGLAFDPDYATNGYFYINYTIGSGAGTTRVSRFSVSADPNVADAGSEVIIYSRQQPSSNHNGGDLAFGPDGYLYISFGDGGGAGDTQNNSQNLGNTLGTILRIDVHSAAPYAVPADNPFVNTPGAQPEIWAYGLRNPWRIGFDRLTGDLWIGDVGQNAWEEVDFWPAGDNSGPNFGWRCLEGFANYNTTGCQPASAYVAPVQVHPTGGGQWCSVIGGRVYRGEQFYRLYGRYLYMDYCVGRIYSLHPDPQGGWISQSLMATGAAGHTVIGENLDGELFTGRRTNGTLYRIVDVCDMAQPTVSQQGSTLTASAANGYVWYLNGQVIPGATGQTLEIETDGTYYVVADLGTNCQLASEAAFYLTTGLAGLNGEGFRVHPNPANDVLVLEGVPAGAVGVHMVDMAGRTVLEQGLASRSGTIQLDLEGLAPGTYMLVLQGSNGQRLTSRPVNVER